MELAADLGKEELTGRNVELADLGKEALTGITDGVVTVPGFGNCYLVTLLELTMAIGGIC